MRGELTGKTKAVIAATMKAALRKTFKAAAGRRGSFRRKSKAAAEAMRIEPALGAPAQNIVTLTALDVPLPTPQPMAAAGHAIDPVDLVTLALDKLGPASFRAALTGLPVTVAVTDPEAAEIIRTAIARSGRASDRHIHVVVAGNG